jgi:hypothetical protein
MHVKKICERIFREIDEAVESHMGQVPRHIHNPKSSDEITPEPVVENGEFDF